MCVTDRHDMTLVVEVVLNPNTIDQLETNRRRHFNPLLDMPISGSSNPAANKDMMSKIRTNGDTIILLRRKPYGIRRNCSLKAISSFPTMFSKAVSC